MKEFIKIVLPHLSKFYNVQIGYGDKKNIQESVLNSFGLENLKSLRDKFEGVLFLDRFTNKVLGVIGIRKYLKLEPIDWNSINPRGYEPNITFENKTINIITVKYGEFPVIKRVNDEPAIIIINREDKDALICGFASIKLLNSRNSIAKLKNTATKNLETNVNFLAFGNLKQFKNQEELRTILNE